MVNVFLVDNRDMNCGSVVGILVLLIRYFFVYGVIFFKDFYNEEKLVEGKFKIKVLLIYFNFVNGKYNYIIWYYFY